MLLIGWGLIAMPSLIKADGESRPATKKEKEFYKTVKTTMAQALPANGPTGWDEQDRPVIQELVSVGVGGVTVFAGPEGPFRIDYHVSWQDNKRKQAADEATLEALSRQYEAQQAQPDSAAMEKLYGQFDKLAKELEKAFDAGDMNQVMKLQAEMEKSRMRGGMS